MSVLQRFSDCQAAPDDHWSFVNDEELVFLPMTDDQ
jgi:hypothetical protein